MLNPQTMTEREERDARDKTFYLLKKYTSYTFLDGARRSYQAFLNAFARQLNDPESIKPTDAVAQHNYSVNRATGFYEERYRGLLKQMIPLEEGLELLRTTPYKEEAYRAILSNDFCGELWGRGADEWGLGSDVFYHTLGYYKPPLAIESDEILGVQIGTEYFRALKKLLWDARGGCNSAIEPHVIGTSKLSSIATTTQAEVGPRSPILLASWLLPPRTSPPKAKSGVAKKFRRRAFGSPGLSKRVYWEAL